MTIKFISSYPLPKNIPAIRTPKHHEKTNPLKRSRRNVPGKGRILKRDCGTPKVRRLQRIPRHIWQTLPRDQRLLPTFLGPEPHLVIDRPYAEVRNLRAGAGEHKGG